MHRFQQIVLIGSALLLSWLLMQVVHELGHIVGAWLTGGRVTNVVLHPLAISRTDVQPNPRPLAVVWAGPMLGIAIPLMIWLATWFTARRTKWACESILRFFAGFCLIANGAYIAFGSIDGIGDCGEMLRHGSPRWLLWLFGAVTIPSGLWLWHTLDRHLRVDRPESAINLRATILTLLALLAVILIELTLFSR